MIIFLYGADSYRRQQKLKMMVAEYQKKHSLFAMSECDLSEEGGVLKLKDLLSAQSLFDNLRLVVAANPFLVEKELLKDLKILLKSALENKSVVLILESDAKPKKDFSFLLEKPVQAQEFELLVGKQLENFVRKEMLILGLAVPERLFKEILNFYATDTWALITELQAASLAGKTSRELENRLDDGGNIFNRIAELRRGQVRLTLPALEKLLYSEDAAKIFNLLAYQMSPSEKIKFADYDVAIKSGKMDYQEALLEYVLSAK